MRALCVTKRDYALRKKERRKEGRKDGRKEGRKEEKTDRRGEREGGEGEREDSLPGLEG